MSSWNHIVSSVALLSICLISVSVSLCTYCPLSTIHAVQVIDLGIVADAQSELKARLLDAARRCDVVVTSGGVSMGAADFVKPLLAELGTVHFGRLNMKPGKPTTFATILTDGGSGTPEKKTLFFGLPGNPVSCLVTKALMIDPCLRRLQGRSQSDSMHTQVMATLDSDLKLDPERPEYHRAALTVDPMDGDVAVARSTGEVEGGPEGNGYCCHFWCCCCCCCCCCC